MDRRTSLNTLARWKKAEEYYEWLNKRYMEAMATRNEVLAQFERYREGLGHLLRQVSDDIVDAEFTDAELPKQVAAPAASAVAAPVKPDGK